jgi:hypothetical protein
LELAFDFIDRPDEERKILDDVAMCIVWDLQAMPGIRSFVRAEYFRNVRLFTSPTEKGKSVLDIFHPLYKTKNLSRGKTVTSFEDDLWIYIERAERLGLISVEFRMPWLTKEDDAIINALKGWYLSEEVDEVAGEWNTYRTDILNKAVRLMY